MQKVVRDRREFNSFDELLTFAEGDAPNCRKRASRRKGEESWAGTASFEEAIKLARFGWPEGLKKMSALVARIESVIAQKATIKQEILYGVTGSCVDVGKFLNGDPECMMDFEVSEQQARGRIFTIQINAAASCSIPAKTLFYRGAAVIAFIDLLAKYGFSCEILLCEAVGPSGNGKAHELYQVSAPIKVAGQCLDEDRVAFACAHPSMLRRILFAVEERESKEILDMYGFDDGGWGGYGRPDDAPMTFTDEARGIYLPALKGWESNFDTEEGAADWVIEHASKVVDIEVTK